MLKQTLNKLKTPNSNNRPQRSGKRGREGKKYRALLSVHKTMTIAHPLMRRWILILFKARLLRFLFWMLIYANEEEIKQVLFVVVERFFPLASHFNMNFMAICVFVEIRWEFRTSFQPKHRNERSHQHALIISLPGKDWRARLIFCMQGKMKNRLDFTTEQLHG